MGWWTWSVLLIAAGSAAFWAVPAYLHWSWRFTKRTLGVISEVAFCVMLVALAIAGVTALLEHMPR